MSHLRAFLVLLALAIAPTAHAASVSSGHVQLELIPEAASIAPGGTIHVALSQKIAPGWHTYWRNPGDAGEPPKLAWTLPPGWRAGEIVWPAPTRLPVGPLMDYGYEGQVLLPIPLTAPANATPGRSARLRAAVSLLVCKDVCIPEDATLVLDLPVTAAPAKGPPDPAVARALADAPAKAALKASMALKDGRLKLAVAGAALNGPDVSEAYFFPYDSTVIDHAKPQLVDRGPQGLTLTMTPGYAFTSGKAPPSLAGALEVDGRAYEIDARPGPPPAGAAGLGPPMARAGDAGGGGAAGPGGLGGLGGLLLAAGYAFLGGVILNLMPCVFPILSMKTIALASHADEAARPRLQGAAFMAGALATFVALAAALIAAKSAGAAVGWGFQLQSPGVVATLGLLMLLIGLNLSGVFEAGQSLQGVGAPVHAGGAAKSFLTGALAVVVAAPCTAPFMAGAIAWALTQNEAAALAVFAALGLGFAAPFTLLSFAPGLLKRLPRPGPWMDVLKRALAFPMYGAAAWLLWVLTLQAGTTALAAALAAAVVLALGAWVYGAAQRAQVSGRRHVLLYGLSAAALIGAAGLAAAGLRVSSPDAARTAALGAGAAQGLKEEPFSPARLAALRQAGRPVFVNFTAAWCITCQVNERATLRSPEVAKAFARTGTTYLKADWTRRDADIAEALSGYGRAGVPLYVVYGADGSEPQILPQILTPDVVTAALEKAGGDAKS